MPDYGTARDDAHPPTIQEVLVAVMRDVRAVAKDDRNTSQGYNFRGIDGTLNALGPALRTHGVVPLPTLLADEAVVVEVGEKRTSVRLVTLRVRYTFVGPAGDHLVVEVPGEAMDVGDKAYTKAMSVAYRTALLQTFALPTQDRDPDADSYQRSPAAEQPEPVDWQQKLDDAAALDIETGDWAAVHARLQDVWKAASFAERTYGTVGEDTLARIKAAGEKAAQLAAASNAIDTAVVPDAVCATVMTNDQGGQEACRALLVHMPELEDAGENPWVHLHDRCENCWDSTGPAGLAACESAHLHDTGLCPTPEPVTCLACGSRVNPEMAIGGHTDCAAPVTARCCGCCGGGNHHEEVDPDAVYDAARDRQQMGGDR